MLAASAIASDIAQARGYRSVDQASTLASLKIAKKRRMVPGLLIPIWGVDGEVRLHQYRPDKPYVDADGKSRKYETPYRARMALDVPPMVRDRIGDPSVPLWITEGARKADAAVSAGLCCVALLGVWNWRGTNELGGKTYLACWDSVALNDRDVFVCFDSDVMTKESVAQAMNGMARFLGSRGATVKLVYLPHGDSAKVGLDDYLVAGHTVGELLELARPADRSDAGHNTPIPNQSTTAQPPPAEPPKLASEQRILDLFKREVRLCGLVGEETTAATLYLVLTSRLLDKGSQVSAGVKGHSSSGKSYTVETVVKFFPEDAVIEMTAMSERALVYNTRDYRHRTLVIYEVVALREGNEDNLTSYFVRSLLSEGRIEYDVTVRDKDDGFKTKTIVKEGPTNLVFTTTKTRVHAENETRVLSLNTDDSRDQTKRVLLEMANEADGGVSFDEWRRLQAWLQHAEHRVTIPYVRKLAELVPPVAVRLRRDFGAILALIRAHAVLHQANRERDRGGRIIATIDDYAVIRELVAGVIAAGVGATVPAVVRETVDAVRALTTPSGVMALAIAEKLDVDKSNASRRLRGAADDGYIRNLEDKRGKPGRWVVGDPMPEDTDLLPQPRNLTQPADHDGCAVGTIPREQRHTCRQSNPLSTPSLAGHAADHAVCSSTASASTSVARKRERLHDY